MNLSEAFSFIYTGKIQKEQQGQINNRDEDREEGEGEGRGEVQGCQHQQSNQGQTKKWTLYALLKLLSYTNNNLHLNND